MTSDIVLAKLIRRFVRNENDIEGAFGMVRSEFDHFCRSQLPDWTLQSDMRNQCELNFDQAHEAIESTKEKFDLVLAERNFGEIQKIVNEDYRYVYPLLREIRRLMYNRHRDEFMAIFKKTKSDFTLFYIRKRDWFNQFRTNERIPRETRDEYFWQYREIAHEERDMVVEVGKKFRLDYETNNIPEMEQIEAYFGPAFTLAFTKLRDIDLIMTDLVRIYYI